MAPWQIKGVLSINICRVSFWSIAPFTGSNQKGKGCFLYDSSERNTACCTLAEFQYTIFSINFVILLLSREAKLSLASWLLYVYNGQQNSCHNNVNLSSNCIFAVALNFDTGISWVCAGPALFGVLEDNFGYRKPLYVTGITFLLASLLLCLSEALRRRK